MTSLRPRHTLARLALAMLPLLEVGHAHAATVTWVGLNDSTWDLATNWSPRVPSFRDAILLNNADTRIRSVGFSSAYVVSAITGTGRLTLDAGSDLTLDGPGSLGAADLLHGYLTNNGRLVVTGASNWTATVLRGSGVTRLEGATTITGTTSDEPTGVVGGHTLELAGATVWNRPLGLNIGQGGTVINRGSFVDLMPNDVTLGNFNGGTGRFINQGSFTKASNTRTLIGETPLEIENTGSIHVDAGYLRLSGSRINSSGTLNIASGAELSLKSNDATLGGRVRNAGTLSLDGGVLSISGDVLVSGSGLTRMKSTVSNAGSLTVDGRVEWLETNLAGAGTTRMNGVVTIAGSNGRGLTGGQTLELTGTTTQTGTGSLNTGGGARVVNLGTWVDAADGNVAMGNFGAGGTSRFDNLGRFTKTSASVTFIGSDLVLNNLGTIDIQAGTLRVGEAFNNQGQLNVAAGAELASTATAFANNGVLTGDGTVRTVGSFFSLRNTGLLAGGGLNDAGTLSLVGGLTIEGGGVFLVDLGSTAAGGFDLLTVSSTASLNGTLAVNLLPGAHFNVGDSFTVMTWNQRLGDSQFASLDLTQAGGYGFAADYGPNSLTLRVITAPVPEPGSWAPMAAGLLGVGLHARRRRASPLR